MFLKFFVQVKKIPIYIIQGNHDVFFTSADDGSNDIGSFVTIFKNTRNVFPFTTYKRVQLLPNFNLHLIPYTNNVDNIYKSIKGLNKHFNLFVFHQDFDFINEEYGISNSVHVNRIVKIDRLMEKLKGHNYYILNGHYHKHKDYDDYNFSIISSLSQNSFSE